jgi:hypothetical protein
MTTHPKEKWRAEHIQKPRGPIEIILSKAIP